VDAGRIAFSHGRVDKASGAALGVKGLSESVSEEMNKHTELPGDQLPPGCADSLANWTRNLRHPAFQGIYIVYIVYSV
jgi:hypothetical protein